MKMDRHEVVSSVLLVLYEILKKLQDDDVAILIPGKILRVLKIQDGKGAYHKEKQISGQSLKLKPLTK